MEQQLVERFATQTVCAIDDLMRSDTIPRDALTYSDVCKHATGPVGDLTQLSERDRGQVIGRVDEALRIRSGGVF